VGVLLRATPESSVARVLISYQEVFHFQSESVWILLVSICMRKFVNLLAEGHRSFHKYIMQCIWVLSYTNKNASIHVWLKNVCGEKCITILPRLLRHESKLVYAVPSEGMRLKCHSGIRNRDEWIIRPLHRRTNWMIRFVGKHEMTKITNSNQVHKSYMKYNSENGCTQASEYIRGGIRCHGEGNSPCRLVTPAMSPISRLDKQYEP
jgi:hypothetical protein